MGGITEKITEFIKDLLTGWITSNLDTMFTDVNTKVETIATEVGKTPQNWNSGIFSMIKNLSDNVIVPIAGMIIVRPCWLRWRKRSTNRNQSSRSRVIWIRKGDNVKKREHRLFIRVTDEVNDQFHASH